jgi:cell wall-associated NlpC family hydrolase
MQKICFAITVVIVLGSCSSNKGVVVSDLYSSKNKRVTAYTSKKSDKNDQPKNIAQQNSFNKKHSSKKEEHAARQAVIADALTFLGTRYMPGGKKPETGFDCSGFTSFVFTKNNFSLNGPSDKQANMGRQKPKNILVPGDLVFFGDKQRISHVAIVVKNESEQLEVIHATTSAGVRRDEINFSKYWNQRYLFGVDIISDHFDGKSSVVMKKP